MKIIVMSPKHNIEDEVQVVTRLFQCGMQSFHLLKPSYRHHQLREYLAEIPKEYHERIIIHTHHKLITDFNLQGVHYTRVHLEPGLKNWWQKKRLSPYTENMVKTCTHRKLLSLYEKSDIAFNYVFLQPVFDPITGKLQSGFYDDVIKKANEKSGLKIIAAGGINIGRIERIRELGFYGMALNTYLWNSEDPVERYMKFMNRCSELNIRTI